MRILVVCGAGTVYGRELITLSLVQGLRRRGHEITCLTTSWGDGKFARLLEENSLSYISLPLGFISKSLSWSAVVMTLDQLRKLLPLWRGYKNAIRQFNPEVVVHSNFHHLVVLWPLLRGGAINVFHVHDFLSPTRFYRFIMKLLEQRLCLFIGVSKFISDALVNLGIPKQKVRCILNGITLGEQTDNSVLSDAKHKVASPEGIVSIGIVGQVGEWKGHCVLVEAMRQLKRSGSAFVCKIFGTGGRAYTAELKRKIAAYDLEDRVQWMGFINKKENIYSAIDICVIPSRAFEAFGMVAAEASFYGIPIVAARCGGLVEVVQDKSSGFLVDPGSAEQLANKLELLLQSEELRVRMGSAARQYANERLTSERMIDEMEKLFSSTITDNNC